MKRPLILYHANCPDGFCSAWVAHLRFGDNADYVPVNYGQDPPEVAGRDVYIVDFSYPKQIIYQMMNCASMTILDHHTTAADALHDLILPPGVSCQKLTVIFDMAKSGARLAWEHFFPNQRAPWLVRYVEDRDLWTWELPESKEISAALSSYPTDFAKWDAINQWTGNGADLREFVVEGTAILRSKSKQVGDLTKLAREVVMAGQCVLVANTPILQSEVAGKLAEGRPFGAVWFQRQDGKIQWSLRSAEDGMDVAAIAKHLGGGGHKHAAGFEMSLPDLVKLLSK